MVPNEHQHKDSDGGFTLDPSQVAEHRAASERRMHTIQMPMVRALGFLVVCVLVILDDWRTGDSLTNPSLLWLIAGNLLYATLSWPFLRWAYGRGGLDWSFVFLHVDVLVWLLNLHHLESSTLFFAYFLLMRVADQVGFGFRRAFYFNHVVAGAYLAYSLWIGLMDPARTLWARSAGAAGHDVPAGRVPGHHRPGDRAPAQAHATARSAPRATWSPAWSTSGKRCRRRRSSSRRHAASPSRPTWRSRSSWPPSATSSARR